MQLVTVHGVVVEPDGAPVTDGELTWQLVPAPITHDGEPQTVDAGPIVVRLDEAGAFSVELVATDDAELAQPASYRLQRRFGHVYYWSQVLVPTPGPWELSELPLAPLA